MISTKLNLLPQLQDLLIEVGELLGKINNLPTTRPTPKLRRESKIRTVFSTVKIEGNNLSFDEVTSIIDGKKVAGKKEDILEVQNALKLYDSISELNSSSEQDYLLAHKILMNKLIDNSGSYRKVDVAIKGNDSKSYKMIFPEHQSVPTLCEKMFDYINRSNDNYIIKSSLIHYLSVSIHPFEDGNGRISGFWQTLFLSENNKIFEFLPIESFIRSRQADYYEYLNLAQKSDDPTGFVVFLVSIIRDSLLEGLRYSYERPTDGKQDSRLAQAKVHFKNTYFSRKDYMMIHPTISDSMATKDLKYGVNEGLLDRLGSNNGTKYKF